MTLQEKLLQVADDLEKESFNYPNMRTMDVVNIVLRKLANEYDNEKIIEDFAIGFANFIIRRKTEREYKELMGEKFKTSIETTTELLEIYKKEIR